VQRLHLFEVEDLAICPAWLRNAITEMISVVHRWLGTANILAEEIEPILIERDDASFTLIDFCSGNGGPMPDVLQQLKNQRRFETGQGSGETLELILTDLHPSASALDRFRDNAVEGVRYLETSVDATSFEPHKVDDIAGDADLFIRTMICSFHHLAPQQAKSVLESAQRAMQTLVIFEMSDGSTPPRWLWWATLAPNFLFGLLVSAFSRPMTIGKFFFSFVIPIIPACFAWDGAVTNMRTYRKDYFAELTSSIEKSNYQWTFKTIPGTMINHIVIVGRPID
jgi:hypothetical protein